MSLLKRVSFFLVILFCFKGQAHITEKDVLDETCQERSAAQKMRDCVRQERDECFVGFQVCCEFLSHLSGYKIDHTEADPNDHSHWIQRKDLAEKALACVPKDKKEKGSLCNCRDCYEVYKACVWKKAQASACVPEDKKANQNSK